MSAVPDHSCSVFSAGMPSVAPPVSYSVRCTALIMATTMLLSACAPLAIGGAAAGAALVATDRRTVGTQLEDKNIALKINNRIPRQLGKAVRVDATAFMGRVLLLGEAPDEATRVRAGELAGEVENVTEVVNQMRLAPVATFEARASNNWLASKVRAALINTRGVPSRAMTIAVNDGVVYLLGRVTRIEGDMAAVVASEVANVKQVVKVFHILSAEEGRGLGLVSTGSAAPAPEAAPTSVISLDAQSIPKASVPAQAASSSVEIMPIQ